MLGIGSIAAIGANGPNYPPAPRGAVTDTYFGTAVVDPYRSLEEIDAPATRAWIEAEARLSASYLQAIPQRQTIYAHLRNLYNYPKLGTPFHYANHYFYYYNTGLQNQAVLYTKDGLHGTPTVLIDPNALAADGTVSIGATAFTNDGTRLAYATQSSGSDWQTWHVRDVLTGRDRVDALQWSKFSDASWLHDKSGFFYERYAAPKQGETFKASLSKQTVYFHRLGTAQSADTIFYARPDHPDWFLGADVTRNGRYVILTSSRGTSPNNGIAYVDLRESSIARPAVHELFPLGVAAYTPIGMAGASKLYFQTSQGAPNGRIMALDLRNSKTRIAVVPERSSALESVTLVGHRLIASYLQDAHSVVRVYDAGGRFLRTVDLPGVGYASGFAGEPEDRVTYYTFANYTTPGAVYAYDISRGRSSLYWKPRIAFDSSQYATKLIFYRSADGTRVPMAIAARKNIALDGTHPAILYGYGGFDIATNPYFSPFIATWLQMGGIWANANIRGGSEYGERWHLAGMLANKQNVFDDFAAAAKYLIAARYTSTPKLAIKGESNGGLLVAAVELQHPELFGAALPGVGVLDMLRFDKFTVGSAWVPEYGCATCSQGQFRTLYAYSPYQNVKAGAAYPPTLISTADHDDRVFPAHSFKFAAAMQHAQAGTAPILLRVDLKAGHGGGKPIYKVFDDYADSYAFLVQNLQMTLPPDFTP